MGLHNLWNIPPGEALEAVKGYRDWLEHDLQRQQEELENLGTSFFPLDVLFEYGFVLGDAELTFSGGSDCPPAGACKHPPTMTDISSNQTTLGEAKMMTEGAFVLTPVGRVEADDSQGRYRLQILEAYRPALRGLGSCTHAIILWWADRLDTPNGRDGDLVVDLPYAPGVKTGIFANRSQARPNPIAITTCFLLHVDEQAGTVDLAWIDAFDGTPVLDIKPYLPMSDLALDAAYPEWLEGFPVSMEAAASFFADPENSAKFS